MFWLFVDFTFYEEFDFILDLLLFDIDEDAGRPFVFVLAFGWFCVDFECDVLPILEWYLRP